MSDLFHRMMDISDPIIVAMSPQPKTMPEKHLPPDMAELLLTELDPSQDSLDPTMHLSLLTTKKKALLISMYQYAMMLTCHLTQNNVNHIILYLCMVVMILIKYEYVSLTEGHKKVGHNREKVPSLCISSLPM